MPSAIIIFTLKGKQNWQILVIFMLYVNSKFWMWFVWNCVLGIYKSYCSSGLCVSIYIHILHVCTVGVHGCNDRENKFDLGVLWKCSCILFYLVCWWILSCNFFFLNNRYLCCLCYCTEWTLKNTAKKNFFYSNSTNCYGDILIIIFPSFRCILDYDTQTTASPTLKSTFLLIF